MGLVGGLPERVVSSKAEVSLSVRLFQPALGLTDNCFRQQLQNCDAKKTVRSRQEQVALVEQDDNCCFTAEPV